MRPYLRFNGGYHYILTVIDVLSKRAWAVPLKSKGESETDKAIAGIIRESERCPKNLQTDIGKEFYNSDGVYFRKGHTSDFFILWILTYFDVLITNMIVKIGVNFIFMAETFKKS